MQEKKIQNVEIIFEELKKHYNLKTYRELARFLDVKEGTLFAWKARNSIGDIDAVIAKCKGISYEWLKTGEGEMFTPPIVAEQGEQYEPLPEPMEKIIELCKANPDKVWEYYALLLERSGIRKKKEEE
jgi:hypothetical protein